MFAILSRRAMQKVSPYAATSSYEVRLEPRAGRASVGDPRGGHQGQGLHLRLRRGHTARAWLQDGLLQLAPSHHGARALPHRRPAHQRARVRPALLARLRSAEPAARARARHAAVLQVPHGAHVSRVLQGQRRRGHPRGRHRRRARLHQHPRQHLLLGHHEPRHRSHVPARRHDRGHRLAEGRHLQAQLSGVHRGAEQQRRDAGTGGASPRAQVPAQRRAGPRVLSLAQGTGAGFGYSERGTEEQRLAGHSAGPGLVLEDSGRSGQTSSTIEHGTLEHGEQARREDQGLQQIHRATGARRAKANEPVVDEDRHGSGVLQVARTNSDPARQDAGFLRRRRSHGREHGLLRHLVPWHRRCLQVGFVLSSSDIRPESRRSGAQRRSRESQFSARQAAGALLEELGDVGRELGGEGERLRGAQLHQDGERGGRSSTRRRRRPMQTTSAGHGFSAFGRSAADRGRSRIHNDLDVLTRDYHTSVFDQWSMSNK
ncbi:unnamed protein product [Trichogramma brassicae]|uniref:Uncharacterized protein n=1 Tax=Trichogramma brassicae TaxID=86971 RepID=A0A6H5I7I7_9HYME|nr:unnamed protein product [Trichogramma brassicae]